MAPVAPGPAAGVWSLYSGNGVNSDVRAWREERWSLGVFFWNEQQQRCCVSAYTAPHEAINGISKGQVALLAGKLKLCRTS